MVSPPAPVVPERAPWLSTYVRPEVAVWLLLAVVLLWAVFTANPLHTVAAVLVLPILIVLLWRRGEVPILIFAATFQWLQVSAKIFQANLVGAPVATLGLTPTVEKAIWLGLLALIVLALGMRLALRGLDGTRSEEAEAEALQIPLSRAVTFYLVCAVLAIFARGVAWASPGLTQPLLAVEGIKWIGFFVLGYVVLMQRRGFVLFGAIVAFEFIQGIGFFSGFKDVLFVSALVVFTVYHRLGGKAVGFGLAGFAGLLILGAAWTSIKAEYREFLNQGSRQQETVVSREDQIDRLTQLVGGLSWDDVTYSIYPLLNRVAYVDFFAATMDYVPGVLPHERGRVWGDALQNLVPRLLYPAKPVLASDSEHTSYYTGIQMASGGEGTSISLGYVADSYIDYGPVWMYVPIFIIGLLWGLMYRFFLLRAESALLGFGFAMAVLLVAYQYEIAAIKLVAGIVVKFIVLGLVLRFGERRMRAWLGLDEVEIWEEEPDEAAEIEDGPAYA